VVRTQQLAVRISQNERTIAGLGWSLQLPTVAAFGDVDLVAALIDRSSDVEARLNGSGVH